MSAVSTYADALFEAAHERGELEATLDNLKEFLDALKESDELRLFFYGTQIPETQKRLAINGLTEGMASSSTNFLKVLTDNDRTEILYEVVLRYEELVKESLGRVEVDITTAVELSEEELNRVKYRLGKVLDGKEVTLQTHIDPELVGGAIFRFGGRQIDGSVRGQLTSLRETMHERGAV